jgi:hypothetical protein
VRDGLGNDDNFDGRRVDVAAKKSFERVAAAFERRVPVRYAGSRVHEVEEVTRSAASVRRQTPVTVRSVNRAANRFGRSCTDGISAVANAAWLSLRMIG